MEKDQSENILRILNGVTKRNNLPRRSNVSPEVRVALNEAFIEAGRASRKYALAQEKEARAYWAKRGLDYTPSHELSSSLDENGEVRKASAELPYNCD